MIAERDFNKVKLLWKYEASAIKVMHDNQMQSILNISAEYGADDIIRLVLDESGAQLDVGEESGWTPLIFASKFGRKKSVKTLIEYGADVFKRTSVGKNVFDYAKQEHNDEIVTLLQDR